MNISLSEYECYSNQEHIGENSQVDVQLIRNISLIKITYVK